MLGTFRKKLQWQEWGSASEEQVWKKSAIRDLSHGDIVTFGMIDQSDISGRCISLIRTSSVPSRSIAVTMPCCAT
jgi:hypothetical protein